MKIFLFVFSWDQTSFYFLTSMKQQVHRKNGLQLLNQFLNDFLMLFFRMKIECPIKILEGEPTVKLFMVVRS